MRKNKAYDEGYSDGVDDMKRQYQKDEFAAIRDMLYRDRGICLIVIDEKGDVKRYHKDDLLRVKADRNSICLQVCKAYTAVTPMSDLIREVR